MFINVKSDYFIQRLFNNMSKKVTLKIIKNNMNIQKRLILILIITKIFLKIFHQLNQKLYLFKMNMGLLQIYMKKIKNIIIYISMIIKKKLKKRKLIKKIMYQKLM